MRWSGGDPSAVYDDRRPTLLFLYHRLKQQANALSLQLPWSPIHPSAATSCDTYFLTRPLLLRLLWQPTRLVDGSPNLNWTSPIQSERSIKSHMAWPKWHGYFWFHLVKRPQARLSPSPPQVTVLVSTLIVSYTIRQPKQGPGGDSC